MAELDAIGGQDDVLSEPTGPTLAAEMVMTDRT